MTKVNKQCKFLSHDKINGKKSFIRERGTGVCIYVYDLRIFLKEKKVYRGPKQTYNTRRDEGNKDIYQLYGKGILLNL